MTNYRDVKYKFRGDNITNIPTSAIATGTLADARISQSSVTQHVTAFDDSVLSNNVAMLAFKVAAADSLSKFNMVDSVIDDFKDLTGVDAGNSSYEINNIDTAGNEYVHGGTASGFVVRAPSSGTSSIGFTFSSLHDGSWGGGFDTPDGQSWPGNWYRDAFSQAWKIRRCRFRMGGNGTGTYRVDYSTDDSTWVAVGTSPDQSFLGTYGNVYEFETSTAVAAYWRVTVLTQTHNTTQDDAWELEWSTSDITNNDLTLISTSTTAEATATTGDLVLLIEDGAGTATLGTDIKGYISRNGNANYSNEVTWVDEGDWGTNKRIIAARGVALGALAGTVDMRYKITTHNQSASKETRIHAASLAWS